MTEEITTVSDLSVAMTTTKYNTTQAVSGQPFPVGKYVQVAVIVIGVVGTAANALILYALAASKQLRKHALIVNQNALDLFSSFFLIVTYTVNLFHDRHVGYWVCIILVSGVFVSWGLVGSVVNIAIISIDRYLKVVHNAWSKKWLGPKAIGFAMAFAWFVGIVANTVTVFTTSAVKDGVCYTWVLYRNNAAKIIKVVWNFVSFYVIIIAIFIFCYGRILLTIRRQAKIMATHSATRETSSQGHQTKVPVIKTNVIKTMMLVSALYAVAWLPSYAFNIFMIVEPSRTFASDFWYASLLIANFYTCTNPFIYATKFDPVRRVLISVMPWKKSVVQPSET